MRTNCLLFLLFFCVRQIGQAQNPSAVFLNTGYTFNQEITLKGETIDVSNGYLLTLGFTRKVFNRKWIFMEIGGSGKTIFAQGKKAAQTFNSTTFRLSIPTKFVFPIVEHKWGIATGILLQNNVDFKEFDFRLRDKYAWRMDGLLELRYSLKKETYLTLGFSWNLRNIPDPYFINDPKMALLVGIHQLITK